MERKREEEMREAAEQKAVDPQMIQVNEDWARI